MKEYLCIFAAASMAVALGQLNPERGQDWSSKTSEGKVGSLNKASTLIGMEVRSSSNDTIGEVQDLVFDLESGRLNYVVVNAREVLEDGQSLIAVAPSSLSPRNARSVTLNRRTESVQRAQSFSQNTYPRLNSKRGSSQGSGDGSAGDGLYLYEWYVIAPDDWQASGENEKGMGSAGRSNSGSSAAGERARSAGDHQAEAGNRTSRHSDYSGPDHGRDWASEEFSRSNYDRQIRSGRGDLPIESGRRGEAASRVFYGQIRDINYANRTLVVENNGRAIRFNLAEDSRLRLNDQEDGRFNHFHENQWVRVDYRQQADRRIATAISETGYIAPNRGQ